MKSLIQSIEVLMQHAGINPNEPGSFNDLLDFYRQEPEGTEEELDKLADAITVVLAAPIPNVTVREFLELSIINFIDLTMEQEMEKEIYFAAKNN